MVKRNDHFENIREETAPRVEPEEGTPRISKDLIEYLEGQAFGAIKRNTSGYPGTIDHVIEVSQGVTYANGQLSVIEHLKFLYQQQNG